MTKNISIVIPTYNGGELFRQCLEGIYCQEYDGKVELIVIDSGSSDGTPEMAEKMGAIVKKIPNEEFSHSKTRNEALKYCSYDKVIFFVQDAVPCSSKWLTQMSAAIEPVEVAAASCRQIPHDDADPFAFFQVNHHADSLANNVADKKINSTLYFNNLPYDEALRAIRLDNVCAIYKRSLLKKHPFPEINFGEDMAWAHLLVLEGYEIRYCPEICVRHSHNRSAEYHFKRSVVDSLACAQIMGRLKDDYSFLSAEDLLLLRRRLEKYALKLKSQRCYSRLRSDTWKGRMMLRNRTIKKIFGKLRGVILKNADTNSKKLMLEKMCQSHISYLMTVIEEESVFSSDDIYKDCLDQVTANMIGRIYGEVYASYFIKGAVPVKIENLIKPFMLGV